jgi:predicted esterase
MSGHELKFTHVYVKPSTLAGAAAPTLLMLHGTGGNEHDLLPLARELAPASGVLSPRGQVLERGMPRFFRRLAEGVFDLEDLQRRTHELADFIAQAAGAYGFNPRTVVAAGFSNGANIAGSLLLLRPDVLAGAMLFRAMVPIVPEPLPKLPKTPVFLASGERDPMVSRDETERLAALLTASGADVTRVWQPAGHELTDNDVAQARDWLAVSLKAQALKPFANHH